MPASGGQAAGAGSGVSHVRDSSGRVRWTGWVVLAAACASFDTVSKPDPPASPREWELPSSLKMLFFLLQVLS